MAEPLEEKKQLQQYETASTEKENTSTTHIANEDETTDATKNEIPLPWLRQLLLKYEQVTWNHAVVAVSLVVVPLVATGNTFLIWSILIEPMWHLILRIIGTIIGIGLGLGLATHVHDRLESWHERHDGDKNTSKMPSSKSGSGKGLTSSATSISSAALVNHHHDIDHGYETTYTSLMTSAGYDVSDKILRGQVIRNSAATTSLKTNSSFLTKKYYEFTDISPGEQMGPKIMIQQWPTLPESVCFQLGRLIEHIVRDYIACWYSMIDAGVIYKNERLKREEQKKLEESKQQDDNDEKEVVAKEAASKGSGKIDDEMKAQTENETSSNTISDGLVHNDGGGRTMVFSTAIHRPAPLMNTMYHSLAIIIGNLTTQMEHVNVFSLLLLKWTKVLSHTFRVYRQLRKQVIKKQKQAQREKRSSSSSKTSLTGSLGRKSKNDNIKRSNSAPVSTSSNVPNTSVRSSSVGINVELMTPLSEELVAGDTDMHSNDRSKSEEDGVVRSHSLSTDAPRLIWEDEVQSDEHDILEVPPTTSKRKKIVRQSVSEMAMTKEFLLSGKLHRAVTFGLDVPSLLFADAKGKDCGIGEDEPEKFDCAAQNGEIKVEASKKEHTEEEVLEKRLFSTTLIKECQLDYHRVLANRLCRAMLPRSEFSSPIIRTMITEMMAGCVLSPIMNLFCPDVVNDWICQGLGTTNGSAPSQAEEVDAVNTKEPLDDNEGKPDSIQNRYSEENEDDALGGDEGVEVMLSHPKATSPKRTNFGNEGDEEGGTEMPLTEAKSPLQTVDHDEDDEAFDDDSYDDDDDTIENRLLTSSDASSGEEILPLLTMSLIELQRFMDFVECREARLRNEELEIDWDNPECRETVRQLVLVIEAAICHGCRGQRISLARRKKKSETIQTTPVLDDEDAEIDEYDESVEVELPHHTATSFSQLLMELTGDIDAFEERVMEEEKNCSADDLIEDDDDELVDPQKKYKPSPTELSTLRTLIAAWLHTGQIYHVISVLSRARISVIIPFYYKKSLFRSSELSKDFIRQLKILDGVDILVDTMAVLSSSSLDVTKQNVMLLKDKKKRLSTKSEKAHQILTTLTVTSSGASNSIAVSRRALDTPSSPTNISSVAGSPPSMFSLSESLTGSVRSVSRLMTGHAADNLEAPHSAELPGLGSASAVALTQHQKHTSLLSMRHIDFHRNEAFASSLRSERERRLQSWSSATTQKAGEGPQIIVRKRGASDRDKVMQREIHKVSRIFYSNTNLVSIRDGARRKDSALDGDKDGLTYISLLTIEAACPRRRIEVPDDDSSFLLRAQARSLNPVGVHRDQRNHEQSFKSFAATYEEPAAFSGSSRFTGGRYVRRCLLRYYPSDRTAQILLPKDDRKMDTRKDQVHKALNPFNRSTAPVLSSAFLRERHLCKKWYAKGAAPRSGSSILTSSVMEGTDFNAVPRTGRAVDFVYRMSLFERPMVDLGSKQFTIHDSNVTASHRADGSSLEISDATLSAALLMIGNEWKETTKTDTEVSAGDKGQGGGKNATKRPPKVEMGPDGYPIVWLKVNTKQGDKTNVEVKPWRTSYVRAALLITATRQEAQNQCLLNCVRSGSARSATKARTEELLWPTFKILEFANSPLRDKQSILFRDLRLGMNSIDPEQLRRNGLLSPRYPTIIRSLAASVVSALQAKDVSVKTNVDSPNNTIYKIKCVAVVELCDRLDDRNLITQYYGSEDHSDTRLFREEWIVYRSFRDFHFLHKHFKTQMSAIQTSHSAGSRLVGAAAAAFTVPGSSSTGGQRPEKSLLPSLGQATHAGALGESKKSIQKRQEVLDGYLKYILSQDNLLSRSSEVLLFLGAFYPFPAEVRTGGDSINILTDPLGRTEMRRDVVDEVNIPSSTSDMQSSINGSPKKSNLVSSTDMMQSPDKSINGIDADFSIADDHANTQKAKSPRHKKLVMHPAIKAKIDQVPLAKVRNAGFELIRHLFGFDDASFLRSRMFSALKTMSFAVTTSTEFRKKLYDMHTSYLKADSLAGLVEMLLNILWPDGVFMQGEPPLNADESKALSDKTKTMLLSSFPDQVKSIMGQDLTEDGLEIFHEMLQNRLVLRSMAYMLLDLLWLDVFPELQDILTGETALGDIE